MDWLFAALVGAVAAVLVVLALALFNGAQQDVAVDKKMSEWAKRKKVAPSVDRFVDEDYGVLCYLYDGGGIWYPEHQIVCLKIERKVEAEGSK